MATRYIGKCKRCKIGTSTLTSKVGRADADMGALFYDEAGESGTFGALAIRCRGCGRAIAAAPVRGTYAPDKKCNAKCLASTGHDCECSCGGKNHGASGDSAFVLSSMSVGRR
jgi:hypothetical protein